MTKEPPHKLAEKAFNAKKFASYFKIVPAPAEFLILDDIFFKDIVYETDVEALNFILNKISRKINSYFLKQYYYKKLQKKK